MKISNQAMMMKTGQQGNQDNKALRQACADFEALLNNQMLTAMRDSLPQQEEGLFAKSYAEKMFQSMLDEEMAKEMAKGRGMGLGEMLYKQVQGSRSKVQD